MEKNKKKIDFIYTATVRATCCMAAYVGIGYGVQSGNLHLCPYAETVKNHSVIFVDNEFKKYNHEKHIVAVKQLRPKYATVRDAMTKEQCKQTGIEYYPLGQILDWALEIEQYTENVIVIPKTIEYIDLIPEKYILGYSVPTKYAGTPFNIVQFTNRQIHILGGSWKKQLELIYKMPNAIVSVDNNHLSRITSYSQFIDKNGNLFSLEDVFHGTRFPNPMDICHALSLGAMAIKIKELNTQTVPVKPNVTQRSLFNVS